MIPCAGIVFVLWRPLGCAVTAPRVSLFDQSRKEEFALSHDNMAPVTSPAPPSSTVAKTLHRGHRPLLGFSLLWGSGRRWSCHSPCSRLGIGSQLSIHSRVAAFQHPVGATYSRNTLVLSTLSDQQGTERELEAGGGERETERKEEQCLRESQMANSLSNILSL